MIAPIRWPVRVPRGKPGGNPLTFSEVQKAMRKQPAAQPDEQKSQAQ